MAMIVSAPGLAGIAAAAGNPGTPQAGTPVYTENFENVTGTNAVGIQNYVGGAAADNETYTADPSFASTANNCNGWVASSLTARPADPCTAGGFWTEMGNLATALGEFAGESPGDATGNHALTEFTGAGTTAGVEMQTSPNAITTVHGHFYAVTADYAAVDYNGGGAGCDINDPEINLSLLDGTTLVPVGTGLDPCTAPGNRDIAVGGNNIRVAQLVSGATLWTGGSIMGVQQYDAQPSGAGNDGATDNISIVDVTPALDKSFSPTTIGVDDTSQLTYTITNTSELDAKDGWTFTDTLPTGLTVADNSASTTCPSGVVTAATGATTVGVTGDLSTGMASCTVTVDVTSSSVGTYTNGPGNVTETGLTTPGSATLTVIPHLGLSVTKTASPNPYVPGDPLTYTVTVANSGPSDATGVTVADPLPAALANAGFTWTCVGTAAPTKCDNASGSGDINTTADIAAGGNVTYTITGTVPPGATGTLSNTATATPPAGVEDAGCTPDCDATVSAPASPHLGLTVTKTATPNPFVPGETLTYTVTVANSGPSDATGVTVADPLPAGLQNFTWTCAGTAAPTKCDNASGSGDINTTADIAAGGHVTYTITGTAPAGQTSALNTATVTPPAGVVDPGCSPDCQATVNPPASPHLDLSVTKTASPDPYAAGKRLTYTVTVKNAGISDAIGVTVRDPLPAALAGAGFTWICTASTGSSCTASGSGDIADTVDIAAGGTVIYTVTGIVPAGTTGSLDNTATATPPPGAVDPGCTPFCGDTADDQAKVSLSVTKTASPDPYVPGQRLTYTITVTNSGPSNATGVKVADPLPSGLQHFTWSCTATAAPTKCDDVSGSGDIHTTADIAVGGHVTYIVTGTAPAGQTSAANTATVTPPAGTADTGCDPDCRATVSPPASPHVDLSVVKTATPNPYIAGRELTYTIVVDNAGPSDATGVTVSDQLPSALAGAGFTWTCAATAAPSKCDDASGSGSIDTTADIAVGGHVTYTVTGTVPAGTTASLNNTATITPAHGSVDPGCDSCSSTVDVPAAGMTIPSDLGRWQPAQSRTPEVAAVLALIAAATLGLAYLSARRRRTRRSAALGLGRQS
jgi:uncharacterized repeat protein (TIGR01451 family)